MGPRGFMGANGCPRWSRGVGCSIIGTAPLSADRLDRFSRTFIPGYGSAVVDVVLLNAGHGVLLSSRRLDGTFVTNTARLSVPVSYRVTRNNTTREAHLGIGSNTYHDRGRLPRIRGKNAKTPRPPRGEGNVRPDIFPSYFTGFLASWRLAPRPDFPQSCHENRRVVHTGLITKGGADRFPQPVDPVSSRPEERAAAAGMSGSAARALINLFKYRSI